MRTARGFVAASALLLAALTAPVRPHAAGGDILPFTATERTLGNGLKVIVVPTGFPNLVSIQIPVQTGSRNEMEPGKSGYAHFFEHLMFRGTPDTPPEKYRDIMTKAGSRDNAGTGDDRTTFYATFAKEHLDRVLGTYADMFQHLAYSEADFKTEARAILGEYNKNSADPVRKLFEVQRERFYQVHTYKHTTMGFIADIENMPNEYQYSKLFFERWYRPEFTTLIVAGDVAPDQVMAIVEKYWGGWKSGASAPPPVPKEPAPKGPMYVHVPWPSDTLPYVAVAFPGPAFSETAKDTAAMELIDALYFGQTSELYKRLVVAEQKVDSLDVDVPSSVDPSLFTVLARVKNPADTVYVRDQILATIAAARAGGAPADRLTEAKSFGKYAFARTLDSTERITSVVASFAAYRRSYETANAYYRTLDTLQSADLQAAARKYFTDAGMIVTTLAKSPLAPAISQFRPLSSLQAAGAFVAAGAAPAPVAPPPPPSLPAGTPLVPMLIQPSQLPQNEFKLVFQAGSADDPAGKEGLAALSAAMIARGGSRPMTIDQIDAVLYPIAGSFGARADKEMTTFTGSIHRDQWERFVATVLPQLVDPGFRETDFTRLKAVQLNALVQDLRSNNEEELGKEQLQINVFRGTPYGHAVLGTVSGLNAITLDDVRRFAGMMYTRARLMPGVSGDRANEIGIRLGAALGSLPAGTPPSPRAVDPAALTGFNVDILEKDTRATAISLGFPIDVKRGDPDFAALWLARTWLGEHRASSGRLYQRIREERGINYGDYAYIEAFPRGMFQFFPDANLARRKQLFEIWIRPVVPTNAHMTLRLALHELDRLVRNGLTQADFETTRGYLMNNVFVMTARQDQQLGYALDSHWYGIGEFTEYMRKAVQALSLEQTNAAIKRHLGRTGMSIVIVTKDAAGFKQALVDDAYSPIKYDGEKSQALLDEDKIIGAMKLNIVADRIRITPIEQVFAK